MQSKIAQPLWYHPTRVLLVDDDENVLKSLGKQIDPNFPFLAYKNPEKALEYLKQYVLPLKKISQQMISEVEPSEVKYLSTENVAIDFSPLRADLDKPGRFNQFVTVIVDKVMKEMDGLDFCRTVRRLGLPVKLILLTGNAGAEEAVAAFNDHIIDAFIRKSPDMLDQVNYYLKTLSFQEFCDSSIRLLGPILNRFSLLSNEKFSHFFKTVCQENNIVEYYLLDSSCSYLLLTAEGKAKIFLVKSSADFKNAYDIAIDDAAQDGALLEALKNRTAFPLKGEATYFTTDSSDWKEAMIPVKKEEDLDFYYAVADQPETALSFERYFNEIWKPQIL